MVILVIGVKRPVHIHTTDKPAKNSAFVQRNVAILLRGAMTQKVTQVTLPILYSALCKYLLVF